MATCPCCTDTLLRHVRGAGIYWFCPHCHQEMPNFSLTTWLSQTSPHKHSAEASGHKPTPF